MISICWMSPSGTSLPRGFCTSHETAWLKAVRTEVTSAPFCWLSTVTKICASRRSHSVPSVLAICASISALLNVFAPMRYSEMRHVSGNCAQVSIGNVQLYEAVGRVVPSTTIAAMPGGLVPVGRKAALLAFGVCTNSCTSPALLATTYVIPMARPTETRITNKIATTFLPVIKYFLDVV